VTALIVVEVWMAVRLEVTRTGLLVHFSGADLIAACSRGLFVPYTRVLGVRVMTRADAVASSPHLPCPGLWWTQRYRAGCWGVGERRQLWSVREGMQVVVIYLTGRPFHRMVVEVDEPDRAHRRIDAALLHSKKTSPRRSLRSHRRSRIEQPGPEPARADQHRLRHRTPNRDLDQVPAHAAPPRLETGSAPESSPTSAAPPRWSRTATAGDTRGDLAVTEHPPPGGIDPIVAARLRLYEYRSSRAGTTAEREGS
jgi:hypothetical protein